MHLILESGSFTAFSSKIYLYSSEFRSVINEYINGILTVNFMVESTFIRVNFEGALCRACILSVLDFH